MAHDARTGLVTIPSADEIIPSYRDARQWILAAAADRRVIGTLLGGAGRYAGGAEDLADLPDGTAYPALTAIVADAGGELWPVMTSAPTAISFSAADIAEASLYAVVKQLAGVSPAAAVGGLADVVFQAQATATAAPAHSLLLGTGVVTGSAFTAFTGVAALPWPPEGVPGPQGPAGPEGPQGPAGPAGEGGSFDLVGDEGAAAVAPDDAVNLVGAESGIEVAVSKAGTDITAALTLLLAASRPGLELVADGYDVLRWRVTRPIITVPIVVPLGNGEDVIATGSWGLIELPWACTIKRWTLYSETSGSLVVDLQQTSYADFPGTWTSICGGAKPTLSSASKARSSTLTGWTVDLTADTVLRYYVDSATTVTTATLALVIERG